MHGEPTRQEGDTLPPHIVVLSSKTKEAQQAQFKTKLLYRKPIREEGDTLPPCIVVIVKTEASIASTI